MGIEENLMISMLFFMVFTYSLNASEIYAQQSLYRDIMQFAYNESNNNLAMLNFQYPNMRARYGNFLITDWIAAFETKQIIQVHHSQGYIYSCEYPFFNYIRSNRSESFLVFLQLYILF